MLWFYSRTPSQRVQGLRLVLLGLPALLLLVLSLLPNPLQLVSKFILINILLVQNCCFESYTCYTKTESLIVVMFTITSHHTFNWCFSEFKSQHSFGDNGSFWHSCLHHLLSGNGSSPRCCWLVLLLV